MKKEKILFALGALIAVAAGAFASKANSIHTFYSQLNGKCSVTLNTTLTLPIDAPINHTFTTKLGITTRAVACPTITVATIN